ncbi:unnamed protein product, partial [Urochloa humidicola]
GEHAPGVRSCRRKRPSLFPTIPDQRGELRGSRATGGGGPSVAPSGGRGEAADPRRVGRGRRDAAELGAPAGRARAARAEASSAARGAGAAAAAGWFAWFPFCRMQLPQVKEPKRIGAPYVTC